MPKFTTSNITIVLNVVENYLRRNKMNIEDLKNILIGIVILSILFYVITLSNDYTSMKSQLNEYLKATTIISPQGKIGINKESIFHTNKFDYVPLIRSGDLTLEELEKYVEKFKPFQIK